MHGELGNARGGHLVTLNTSPTLAVYGGGRDFWEHFLVTLNPGQLIFHTGC